MMKVLFQLLLLFFIGTCSLFAQNYRYGAIGGVTAKSGLIVRSKPSTTAAKITTIPYNTPVYYFINTSDYGELDKQETIGGITNYWREVYYNGEYGYVFGGYLGAAQNEEKATANIFGILSDEVAIYSEPYGWSSVVAKVKMGDEVYVFNPKSVPANKNKSVFVKVRFNDKVGYIASEELTEFYDFRMIMSDYFENQSED